MDTAVRAKKHLGQHFLRDENIALKIVESLSDETKNVLEIGPGMGVLTKYLLQSSCQVKVIEIDTESVEYLSQHYPALNGNIISGDFLKLDISGIFQEKFSVIGNFPYNISGPILFKIYENRNQITEAVGMFQKEVAERVAAKPGSKTYGILSVLLTAFYTIDYLFTVHEHVFSPPPKVKSAVIRLRRNAVDSLPCNEKLFTQVVKTAFNQRRKTLRNALKPLCNTDSLDSELLNQRAEQLSVENFIDLTKKIEFSKNNLS